MLTTRRLREMRATTSWRLTVDQRAFGRINAGQLRDNESGSHPTTSSSTSGATRQLSSWDVAECCCTTATWTRDIFTMEVYFATSTGELPSLFPTLPSAQSPILLMNAASVSQATR
jgi:hypothetical protein